jgi:uncharacterized membrane protein
MREPSAPTDKSSIAATVSIHRPVEEVFSFYRDFRNMPSFLGDVMAVEPIDSDTSRWTIQGPLGIRLVWSIRVTEEIPNRSIRYETVAPPGLRTTWEVRFASCSAEAETEVRETLRMPLGRLGHAALALVGKFPAAEVGANLHRLKQIMETGRVTDRSHAVPGKFCSR